MILEDRLTDSERVELEKIFSEENLMPKKGGLTKTRNLRKLNYICISTLFILSILVYFLLYFILSIIYIITFF